jgi:hypothetical protein
MSLLIKKTLAILIIILSGFVGLTLTDEVRTISSDSCTAYLSICIIIYKENIPEACGFYFTFLNLSLYI